MVNNGSKVKGTVGISEPNRVIAVDGRLPFHTMQACTVVVILAVGIKRILGISLKARKGRRCVGNRVVIAVKTAHHGAGISRILAPGGPERRQTAEKPEGTVAARETAHPAEGDGAESAGQVKLGLTAKKAVILREAPRVRNETVFKNEADLKPIAEVFRTLQAKSGTGGHAGLHLEGVNRIDIRQIGICMLINQTGINNTIKGDISSQG